MIKKTLFIFVILGLVGASSSEAKVLFPFKGEVDLKKKEFLVTVNPRERNPLSLRVAAAADDVYHVVIKADDLKTPFFDISTVLETTLEMNRRETGNMPALKGRVESKYTLINYQPVQEVSGRFEIKDRKIVLSSISLGDVSCRGSIQFVMPIRLDLAFRLSGVGLKDFIDFFAGPKDILAEGEVVGEIYASGPIDQVLLEGKLFSYNGFVKKLEYSSIMLNAEGIYPDITIADSTIVKADGFPLNVSGNINLGDKKNLVKQIKSLNFEPLVSSDGSNVEWTLKRVQLENEAGTTELKYLFRKNNGSGSPIEEDSDMLGIERKMEF